MQKIDASKLVSLLLEEEKTPEIKIILSDEPIFQRIVEEKLRKKGISGNLLYTGKDAVAHFINALAASGLFEPPRPGILDLGEKYTQKQWGEDRAFLNRLPSPVEVSVFLFAPTSARNFIKVEDIKTKAQGYLCYSPQEIEQEKTLGVLFKKYPQIGKKYQNELPSLIKLALETFSGDLISCDLHFERMEQLGLDFSSSLAGNPKVNAFHVAQALAEGDRQLVELRLSQCELAGEEVGGVFMAIVYFLKQLCSLYAGLETTRDLKMVFEQQKIPYPSQRRLQLALQKISAQKLSAFFLAAPVLEMRLRTGKQGYQELCVELIHLL